MTIIGFDFDGTLVASWTDEPLPGARERLAALPTGVKTFIATNQAGPAFRAVTGDPRYPTVEDVARRIAGGLAALDWRPDLLLIAVWSGKAGDAWDEAATHAQDTFATVWERVFSPLPVIVSAAVRWRKPNAGMLTDAPFFLRSSTADILYIGDMDTDEAAAHAAGCRFQHVDSWLMEGLV